MENTIINLAILAVTAGFGWLIIAYEGYANTRGWTVGAWFSGPFTWLQGIGYFALIGAAIISFFVSEWWAPIVVLVAANVLVRILLPVFKAQSQVVAIFGVLIGIGLSIFYVWL